MLSRAFQIGLAALLLATSATAATAKPPGRCSMGVALAAPNARYGHDAAFNLCAAASPTTDRDQLVLGLILICCAAGIGGQASRRRGVKMVFS